MQDLGDRREGKGREFGNPQCRTPKLFANVLLLVTIVSKAWSSAAMSRPNSQAAARKNAPSSRVGVWTRGVGVAMLLGATASAAACFLIPNLLPVADIDVDKTDGIAPLTIHFDGMGSFDPDGTIRRYEWAFGDGDRGTGAEIEHAYSHGGTFNATLTVTDQRGGRGTDAVAIHVRESNALPVAAFSVSPSPAFPNQGVQLGAAASYDPDGQIVSYAWTYGDGSGGSGKVVWHQYSAQGTYNIILTVRDNDGGERTATVGLRVTTTVDTSRTIARHYDWAHDEEAQSCDLEISRDLYAYYKSQPRIAWGLRDYDEYVLDPLDDEYLEAVTQEILGTTASDRYAAFEDALFFVQNCIEYVYDPLWYEYPRYPVEMLVDQIGDCEDTAILYASLVRTLGYGALMVAVDTSGDGNADHMVVWVPVEQAFVDLHPDRSFWDYGGKTYAFAETAVEGGYLALGVDPWGLTEDDVDTVYDVSSVDRDPKAVHLGPSG
jgi:PKD repeat protein